MWCSYLYSSCNNPPPPPLRLYNQNGNKTRWDDRSWGRLLFYGVGWRALDSIIIILTRIEQPQIKFTFFSLSHLTNGLAIGRKLRTRGMPLDLYVFLYEYQHPIISSSSSSWTPQRFHSPELPFADHPKTGTIEKKRNSSDWTANWNDAAILACRDRNSASPPFSYLLKALQARSIGPAVIVTESGHALASFPPYGGRKKAKKKWIYFDLFFFQDGASTTNLVFYFP